MVVLEGATLHDNSLLVPPASTQDRPRASADRSINFTMKAGAGLSFALGLLASKVQGIGSVGQAEGSIDTSPQPFDLNGSNYTYPHPVHVYNFESQFQELQMAFMDVPPAKNVTSNGQVAVLFHG